MLSALQSCLGLAPYGLRGIATTAAAASLAAVEKLVREMKGRRALPWENTTSEQDAATALGAFWGVPGIRPGDVLDLDAPQIEALLSATTLADGNDALDAALFAHAESITRRFFGHDVYYRGIVEFSNVCENDCGYCGIRKHQPRTSRYTVPIEEVVSVAEWAWKHRMGTLMLQSGELNTPKRNAYIVDMVRRVKQRTIELDLEQQSQLSAAGEGDQGTKMAPSTATAAVNHGASEQLGLCVALSVGELPLEQYKAFKEAGADRYLLRIETSNPDLYATLHPPAQTWDNRVRALMDLKAAGFQIGTGVMVGLPGQTLGDLASDIVFFRQMGADMIGMGPYITEPGTPVAAMWEEQYGDRDKAVHMAAMLKLTTRMNALARITLGNVNIAATTALQAIDPLGRELALRRGANVLMPILTPTKYREHYTLYEGKPCINDTADECQKCLGARLAMVDKKLKPGIWGDPPSFRDRLNPVPMRPSNATTRVNSILTTPPETPPINSRRFHAGSAAWQQAATDSCDACGATVASAPKCHVPTKEAFAAAAKANGPGPAHGTPSGGPLRGSDVPRTNIGIFGRMNAGKSSLMNRLARADVSIVDSTPGTTADTKITLMELHSAGPVKLFDTAGIDEEGVLGDKKRRKVLSTVKECDVAAVVVSLPQLATRLGGGGTNFSQDALHAALEWEKVLLDKARTADAQPVLVFNLAAGSTTPFLSKHAEQELRRSAAAVLNPDRCLPELEVPLAEAHASGKLTAFLERAAAEAGAAHHVPCLPEQYLSEDAMVFLNIPMDAETPTMRLLRPQALVQEEAIRAFATTVAYRMNLDHARSSDPDLVEKERRRFLTALRPALEHPGPVIMVTDSQAVDIVHPWTLDQTTHEPLLPFTTFSIAMIQRQSRGALHTFARGIDAFRALKPGDRVLVAEACNHNRITEICNDIGTVQIPQKLQAAVQGGAVHSGARSGPAPRGRVIIEHAFGREFPELDDPATGGLKRFALAVHCGGCMVDAQKIRARVSDLEDAGVPVTNYGLLLAYAHSPAAMQRALEPWGLKEE